MGEFPKRLTEVFQTSDAKIFGTEIEAKRHERKLLITSAIQVARDAFQALSPVGRSVPRDKFDALVADELERSGVLPPL